MAAESSKHLSRAELLAYRRRDLTSQDTQAIRHLASCDSCQRRTLKLNATENERVGERSASAPVSEGEPSQVSSKIEYSKILDQVFEAVVSDNQRLEWQRSAAAELYAGLSKFPLGQQRLLVKNDPRYQTWGLTEFLLERGRSQWSEDPASAEELVQLALTVASFLSGTGYRHKLLQDLRAEAWSYVANCRRINSDLRGAAEAFSEAEAYLEMGTGDALERARYLDLKTSYFRASRQFEAATRTMAGAIEGFRASSEPHLEGRALLAYSKLMYDTGQPEKSLAVLGKAYPLLDFEREPYLEFVYKLQMLWYLTALGRNREAFELLPEVRALSRSLAPRLERLRFLWLEGVLRWNSGQAGFAEEALKQVREGFIAAAVGYDVALVSLDLASLYLLSGRTLKVREIVAEMVPIFSALNVERELLAAWALLKNAADREELTLQILGEVASRIRGDQPPAVPGLTLHTS